MAVVRTVSPVASAVLERVAEARRQTISLPADSEWLKDVTPSYRKLLDSMEQRQLLYRVLRGSYVVAPRATDHPDQAAPPELLVDLVLRDRTPYYLGFLSAFIAHGLTDLHSSTMYVAVPQDAATHITTVDLAGTELRLVRLSKRLWPAEADLAVETQRVIAGTREFVVRATVNRALVDGLLRPDLCAGIETVVMAWSRARHLREFDPEVVWRLARASSVAVAKRTAVLLRAAGYEDVVSADLPALKRKRSPVLLDRNDDYGMAKSGTRDTATGVTLNVPDGALQGWMAEEAG
jgi:predicted transcriptional regulator of viral defense system